MKKARQVLAMWIGACVALSAGAGSFTWTGGAGDGKWTSAGNWSGASGTPAAGDTVTIANAGTSELAISVDAGSDAAPLELAGLTFGTGGAVRITGNPIRLTGTYGANCAVQFEAALVLAANDAVTFEIGSKTTNTLAGVVSGAAGLAKTGNGMLVLTASNTYAGGTTIGNGSIEVRNAQALGTSTDSVRLAASGSTHGCLRVGSAMTFAYPLETEVYTAANWSDRSSAANVWAGAAVTFTGAVTGQVFALCTTANVTVDATVDLPGGLLYLYPGSKTIEFKQRVVAADMDWYNRTGGGNGTVNWYSGENRFDRFRFEYKNNVAKVDGAFGTNAVCALGYCEDGRSRFTVGATAQTIDRIDYSLGDACVLSWDWRKMLGHNVIGSSSSATPGRLTMRATADTICDVVYQNYLTLVWWPQGNYTYRTFDNNSHGFGRIATMTGAIVVSNGTFVVNGTNAFPNVTHVEVASGATFSWESASALASGGLGGVKSVSVGEGGTFRVTSAARDPFAYEDVDWSCSAGSRIALPEGTTFAAKSFQTNGVSLLQGLYTGADDDDPGEATKLDLFSGHVRITVRRDASAVTSVNTFWTGAGSDEKISTAANWQDGTLPAFATGQIRPVIAADAAQGRTVKVDGSYELNGLLLRGGAATVAADPAAAQAQILLGRDGVVTEEDSAADARTHEIDVPLVLQSAQTWNVTNAGECVRVLQPLRESAFNQTGTLTKTGPGTLAFVCAAGASGGTFGDAVAVRQGKVLLSGRDPLGASGQVDVYTTASKGSAQLVISNLVTSKAIRWRSDSAHRTAAVYAQNTTNVFLGSVLYDAVCNNTIPPKTRVVFAGGYGGASSYVNIAVNGEMIVTNTPMTLQTYEGTAAGVIHLYASSNSWGSMHAWLNSSAADNWRKISHQPGVFNFSFHAPDAVVCTQGQTCLRDCRWRMNGYDAWLTTLWAGSGAVFDSDCGEATLHVKQAADIGYYFTGTFTGGAGLHKYGTAPLAIWSVQSSTGCVSVTEGTLAFTNSASWATAREVCVTGTGRLEAWSTGVLGRHTNVRLADSGVYAFGNATTDVTGEQAIGYLYLDGSERPAPKGTYCAADANGNPVVAGATPCAHISGRGVLRSLGDGVGTVLLFR